MSFLYPTFLYALAALAIPVIIHLFYFRRFRKVYFSNVRFLREVKEERSMRSRLRNLLVLLLRCLALAALVVAFAQPFLPVSEQLRSGRKAVSLYVDNSFSMAAESDRAPLLQLARDRARDIVEGYGPEDRFQILDNSLSGRSQRLVGQEAALEAIEEIRVSPESRLLSQVLDRQRAALGTEELAYRIAYLISDFQRNVTDLEVKDTAVAVNLLPLEALRSRNVGIDSAWFEAPVAQLGQNNLLLVRVRNYGSEPADNIRLSVAYDGQTKPEGSLQLPAEGFVVDSVYLPVQQAGSGRATLSVTDFPVTFDDTYHIAFQTTDRVRVLNIDADGSPDRNLAAALALSVFSPTFASLQNIDYGTLAEQQLVVLTELPSLPSGLAEQLRQYVREGGNLLLFPPTEGADLDSYNSFLSSLSAAPLGALQEQEREVTGINEEEFVFNDIFERSQRALNLPTTRLNYPIGRGGRGQRTLLAYRDGSPAVVRYPTGAGNLYLSSAPLPATASELVGNAEVFIPMLYKMGISSGRRRPLAYTIGQDEVVETGRRQAGADLVYQLRGPGGEFIPQQRQVGGRVVLGLSGQVPEAGVYDLVIDGEAVEAFAFNYDRREADLRYTSREELEDLANTTIIDASNTATLSEAIREGNEGRPLWRYFVWAALAFLLGEVLVLRFWRV